MTKPKKPFVLGAWGPHETTPNRQPNIEKAPEMPGAILALPGRDRMEFGVIVTAREQDTDERWILHRAGKGSLLAVCAELDAAEGNWKVLTISTPETIFRDLQGTRYTEWGDRVLKPEAPMLGKHKRLDLLDPSHDPAVERGKKHV